jgi:hypothetical protein
MDIKNRLFLCVISLVFFSNCARYKTIQLNKLSTSSDKSQKPSISFAYQKFDKNDCRRYLDRNVISKGYQPVHITLTNNTKRYLKFSKANISMPIISITEVAKRVHTNTVARATSYGVASLIVWPLVIPAIVDGVGSSQANHRLDEDFSKKELSDQVISPFNTINGIIFVSTEKFDPNFIIKLFDANSHVQFSLTSQKPVLDA